MQEEYAMYRIRSTTRPDLLVGLPHVRTKRWHRSEPYRIPHDQFTAESLYFYIDSSGMMLRGEERLQEAFVLQGSPDFRGRVWEDIKTITPLTGDYPFEEPDEEDRWPADDLRYGCPSCDDAGCDLCGPWDYY